MATSSASAAPDLPSVTVTDIKNWVYCPRVPYYITFLPHRPTTFKMDDGHSAHAHTTDLEHRRSLRAYGLSAGDRYFHVHLQSERLGLSGLLDMAIVTPAAAHPVEYKTGASVSRNHQCQLAAYALLVEERWRIPVPHGYIYLIPTRRAHRILITDELRTLVLSSLDQMRHALARETKPPPTPIRARCTDCEYRRYCLDL